MKYLQQHRLDCAALDLEALLHAFRARMAEGLAGQGPLPMIPSSFLMPERCPCDCEIPVFDVGGTNVRSARIRFDAMGKGAVTALRKSFMPGAKGHVSKKAFYDALCENLLPNVRPHETLGFCFSYPVSTEGVLLFWTKHIDAPEIVGTNVREGLEQALAEHGCPGVKVVILNDTVATLLASYTLPEREPILTHVGFILGTGTNCAYNEKTEAVVKAPTLPPQRLIPINCETGNFPDVPFSDFDKAYAATSEQVRNSPWESCISGTHLEHLGTLILHTAAKDGLFSDAYAKRLLAEPLFTNICFNALCTSEAYEAFPEATTKDKQTTRRLLIPMFERAAHFAAVNLAAAALAGAEGATGGQASKHIRFNIDGSTFWKTEVVPLSAIVARDLDELLGARGLTFEIVQIDDAPLLGAALACV